MQVIGVETFLFGSSNMEATEDGAFVFLSFNARGINNRGVMFVMRKFHFYPCLILVCH